MLGSCEVTAHRRAVSQAHKTRSVLSLDSPLKLTDTRGSVVVGLFLNRP